MTFDAVLADLTTRSQVWEKCKGKFSEILKDTEGMLQGAAARNQSAFRSGPPMVLTTHPTLFKAKPEMEDKDALYVDLEIRFLELRYVLTLVPHVVSAAKIVLLKENPNLEEDPAKPKWDVIYFWELNRMQNGTIVDIKHKEKPTIEYLAHEVLAQIAAHLPTAATEGKPLTC